MALKLKVKQVRSSAGKPMTQRLVLKSLGLRRINKTVEVVDTPATRGMIRKVSHLITVAPVE